MALAVLAPATTDANPGRAGSPAHGGPRADQGHGQGHGKGPAHRGAKGAGCVWAKMVVIEGRVVSMSESIAEYGRPVVAVGVHVDGRHVELLLAPAAVLDRSGFRIAVGDEIHARAFVQNAAHPPIVQRIHNWTRPGFATLRTHRGDPVWSPEAPSAVRTAADPSNERRPTP